MDEHQRNAMRREMLRFENVLSALRARRGKEWKQTTTAELLGMKRRRYVGLENADILPTEEDLRLITLHFGLDEEERDLLYQSAKQTPPKTHNLPHDPNRFFTGRQKYFEELYRSLRNSQPGSTVSICGMGGIGKTQLALEYAHRCYKEDVYRTILWMDRSEYATYAASIKEIQQKLSGYPSISYGNVHQPPTPMASLFLTTWLQKYSNWLLVIDNIGDVWEGSGYVGTKFNGHILITSRSQFIRGSGIDTQIRLREFDAEEGVQFLLHRSRQIALPEDLTSVEPALRQQALWLVHSLGGHALALDQAAAYIEESAISLEEYIELYNQERTTLLDTYGASGNEYRTHPETVASTILLSLQRVEAINKQASAILYFCSLVLPDNIPDGLLREDTELHGSGIKFHTAISVLRRYSLIERNAATKTYSIHKIVHTVVAENMSPEMKAHWVRRILRAVKRLLVKHPGYNSKLDAIKRLKGEEPEYDYGHSIWLWIHSNGQYMFGSSYLSDGSPDNTELRYNREFYEDWVRRH